MLASASEFQQGQLGKSGHWCPIAPAVCQQHWAGPWGPRGDPGSSGPEAPAEVIRSSSYSLEGCSLHDAVQDGLIFHS